VWLHQLTAASAETGLKEDRSMEQKTFSVIAGVIFALVALVHLVRIYFGWSIVIGGWSVPMWPSWVAFVGAGALSYFGLRAVR
jgi:hypothetical protein